jgi:hypothetical protein
VSRASTLDSGAAPAVTGYASADYARSLADLGRPVALPRSGGWLLERPVPGTPWRDAMGCYPLFACADWSRLRSDLDELPEGLVSVVLVTDPFGAFAPGDLRECFPDRLSLFKEHLVVDLGLPAGTLGTAHHRRNVRKALASLEIERHARPAELSGEWARLYAQLVARHAIGGPAAFSPASLARQLRVPGLVALRALRGEETVGMTLWFVQGDVAYYHLAAYSEEGYRRRASFGLFFRAIESFAEQGLRWLDLGAGAGAEPDPADGLVRFKRGWATTTRTAYLCGRICDRPRYVALTAAAGAQATPWFPAYRAAAAQGLAARGL